MILLQKTKHQELLAISRLPNLVFPISEFFEMLNTPMKPGEKDNKEMLLKRKELIDYFIGRIKLEPEMKDFHQLKIYIKLSELFQELLDWKE